MARSKTKSVKRSKSAFMAWYETKYVTRKPEALRDGEFTYMAVSLLKEAFEAGKRSRE